MPVCPTKHWSGRGPRLPHTPGRQAAKCCLAMLVFAASATIATGAQGGGESVAGAVERIERQFGRPFADVVRSRLWSLYCTSDHFARELGVTRAQLRELLRAHEWDLMHPPALRFQNRSAPNAAVRASADGGHTVPGFVDRHGRAAKPNTRATVACDGHNITVSVTCGEPNPQDMVLRTPAQDPQPPKVRAYWEGDLVPLRKMLFKGKRLSQEKEWAQQLEPPDMSVLLDECVVIFLTPIAIGKDLSHLALAHLAPDPAKILTELRPRKDNRVFLEGAFYFVAVSPKGAVLDVFHDPWDEGTFCPAWHSKAKVSATILQGRWEAEVQIPLKSLKPNVNEDSVWGMDLCRIQRGRATRAQVTRSRGTTFVKYDRAMPPSVRRPLPTPPSISVAALPQPGASGRFPTGQDWARSTMVGELSSTGSARTLEPTHVRMAYDERHVFVRFDCQEKDLSRLKVVTREQEEKAYGKGNRRCNYLDRRESWGLGWGDYVEVLLAPGLESADPFHAGLFQFVVDSRGDLLERYYDTFGMFTVPPHPAWRSGAQVRVEKSESAWSVELAIPFSVLCTSGKAPTRWGLNLHRCVSPNVPRAREAHLFWSPVDRVIRDPRRLGTMIIDPRKIKVGASPNRPGPAPGRPHGPKHEPLHRTRDSDRLASVCFVDRDNGWAVGGRGTILHTSDGGDTWQEQTSGTDFILEDVFFVDRRRGWAVGGWPRDTAVAIYGGMGVILATSDGGKTWRPQLEGQAVWLSAICFVGRSSGWAVGEYGTVMRTRDGGATWVQMRNVPTPAWLRGVHFVNPQQGWAVGRYETVLRTNDAGESWVPQDVPPPYRPFGLPLAYRAIRFASASEGWIVGDHGNILHTSDGGKTWAGEAIDLPAGVRDLVNLSDLAVTKDGAAWAVSPVALIARQPGVVPARWSVVKTGIPAWLRGISFAGTGNGWVVGDRNTVIRTGDDGRSWGRQRHSGRRMGLLYATPHDHHINNSAMGMLNEEFDNAYVLFGRVLRPFELGGDVNDPKNDAATMALGVAVGHNFNEFSWRERDEPHRIAERYQHHAGIEPMERRLVAMIRILRPEVLVGEQPVVQEGYYAHGVGQIARAVVAAFDSAGDPKRFPELIELGLEPFAPKKLYLTSMWPNELYPIHPPTLRIPPVHKFSERLGMTYGEAALLSRQVFWGLLDRGRPPATQKPWPGRWSLHLKASRISLPQPEQDIFDGIR